MHRRRILSHAAWRATGSSRSELVALRRRDSDLDTATVRITRELTEVNGRAPVFSPPKTAVGRRVVIIPSPVLPVVEDHLEEHAQPGPDGLLFTSPEESCCATAPSATGFGPPSPPPASPTCTSTT